MKDTATTPPDMPHDAVLGVLARADAAPLTALAEALLPALGEIEVVENRTGLVMLPMTDTAQGTHFHLGEVLMSEAHIRVGEQQGYALRRGRDLEAAMAMAVIDLALAQGRGGDACAAFLRAQATAQADADRQTLRAVEATRVEMETF